MVIYSFPESHPTAMWDFFCYSRAGGNDNLCGTTEIKTKINNKIAHNEIKIAVNQKNIKKL